MKIGCSFRFFPMVVGLLLSTCFFLSCHNKRYENPVPTDSLLINNQDTLLSTSRDIHNHSLYYGLYSPADVASIFEEKNLVFNPGILNATKNAVAYVSSAKTALNLGVYGADLAYIKLFNEPQYLSSYLTAIMDLASNLAIPSSLLQNASLRIDANLENPDSLKAILSATYDRITSFLSEQGRAGNAYLIITGGFVEAMYITTEELYTSGSPIAKQRILEQKFALEYLLSSLKQHYNDPSVAYYYRILFVLHKYLSETTMAFQKDSFSIDHQAKTIQFSGSTLYYDQKNMEKIRNIIASIREIITEE